VWLDGGPSHYETFDPAGRALGNPRRFKDIPTPLPGVHFSDCIPKLAAVATVHHCALIITDPNHGGGNLI
jgi:hypothetical protein